MANVPVALRLTRKTGTGYDGYLPDILGFDWTTELGPTVGGGWFKYPVGGTNAAALVPKARFGIMLNGVEPNNGRFIINTIKYDPISDDNIETRVLTCYFSDMWSHIDNMSIHPLDGAVRTRPKHFGPDTPGEVGRFLLVDSHDRGSLLELDRDFDQLEDSAGDLWEDTIDFYVDRGTSGLEPLKILYDGGSADMWFDKHTLRMFNRNTQWENYAGHINDKIVLWVGKDLLEGPKTIEVSGMCNEFTVYGDEGRYATARDEESIAQWGEVFEGHENMSGIKDPAKLQKAAELFLEAYSQPVVQHVYGLKLGEGHDPLFTYRVGDEILIHDGDTSTGRPEKFRIVKVRYYWDEELEDWGAAIAVNTWLDENLLKLQRRLNRMADNLPGGGKPDRFLVAPAAPTDVVWTAVWKTPEQGGSDVLLLEGEFTPPTLEEDGAPLGDLDHYIAQWHYVGDARSWGNTRLDASDAQPIRTDPLEPGRTIGIRLRAVDEDGNMSPIDDEVDEQEIVLPSTLGGQRTYDQYGALIHSTYDDHTQTRKAWVRGEQPGGDFLRGLGLDATGPGIREDEAQYEVWGADGSRTIHFDYGTGSASFTGSLYVGGVTELHDATTIYGTLTVHADSTFDGDVNITDTLVVSGTSSLGGTLTLAADLIAAGHTLSGARLTTGTGNVIIDNNTISVGINTIGFSGGLITRSNGLAVTGALSTSSSFTVTGSATLNGNCFLGNAPADLVGLWGGSGSGRQTIDGRALSSAADRDAVLISIRSALWAIGFA